MGYSISEPSPSKTPARLFTRAFWFATAGNFFFFLGMTAFFVLPLRLEDLGASRADIGRVMGSFGVSSVIAIPITGSLVDRFGCRRFMLGGAALWAVATGLFPFVSGMGVAAYVLRMLQGVAFAMAFISANAFVVGLAPRGALGRALSVFGATTLCTHALGPAIAEIILHRLGFRTLCVASATCALAAFAIYAGLAEAPREPVIAGGPAPTLIGLALRPGAASVLLGGLATALAFGAVLNFMAIFVRTRGIPSFSPFFAGYVGAAMTVRLAFGGVGDRFGHRRVGAIAMAFFAASVAALAAVHDLSLLVAIALVFGVAHGWAYPSLNALFVEGAAPAARGRAMALYNLSFNLGITVAAFAGGEIAEHFGYSAMWLVIATCTGAGAIVVAVSRG